MTTVSAGRGTGLLGLGADRLAWPGQELEAGVVWVDPDLGTIVDVVRAGHGPAGTRPDDVPGRLVELGDRTIAPGFVDVHVHGGDGHQVNGASPTEVAESVAAIAAFHARHGTTALLATTVSDSPDRLRASVAGVARAARERRPGAARVLGCHLEGPFISPARAGAQDRARIRPPDAAELSALLEVGEGTLRVVTLAPELEGADLLVAECVAAGVTVALGHSDADVDTARAAFDAGATHVTHLFDAMAPFHHRSPGLVAAALLEPRATLELICDLHHVHPQAIALAARTAPGRLVLVTDASGAAGMPPGPQRLGEVDVEVDDTRVTLASDPSTLAGSVLTMERAVRNAVRAAGMALADALRAASAVPVAFAAPRETARPAGHRGGLEPGAPADLVVLDPALEVVATIVAGSVVYEREPLLA
ncbi:MAG TPA: N-acetylglucosamine-6-phosphate deacetylase [Acidimicrobiales bacterium]|nr:N-acetylglucosamine-6-phosphate deacetylase [Acidimicrobiales bacterium]